MASASANPVTMSTVPESVAFFFNGEPMAGKAEKYMSEYVADSHTVAFVGPHAMKLPVLDKATFGKAAGNLIGPSPTSPSTPRRPCPRRTPMAHGLRTLS